MAYKNGKDYLLKKRIKLNQNSNEIQQNSNCPQIFNGKVFFINGFISAEYTFIELKRLIVDHGGNVQTYLDKSVYLIIATAMTDSKIRSLNTIVVKPTWIWESIRQGKMMNVNNHLLFKVDPNQPRFPVEKITRNGSFEAANHNENVINSLTEIEQPLRQIPISSAEINFEENDIQLEAAPKNLNLCLSPTFITDFFNQSRLHHLTSWKYKLISFISEQMIMKFKTKSRKITETSVLLHVDMDSFFVSVMLRDRRDLKDKPVGIFS